MAKQNKTALKVFEKSFDYQQPLSTFDLDDEIIPKMLLSNNSSNADIQILDRQIPRNSYPMHQTANEFCTIYEKGDEEKTFHNEELEKRSDLGNVIRKDDVLISEYPTGKIQSETNDNIHLNKPKKNAVSPEYYEQLLFVNGKSPMVSTKTADENLNFDDITSKENISGDYEDVQVEEAKYENQTVIDAVDRGTHENSYENVEYVKGRLISSSKRLDSEGLYAIGRRFPSFRIINGLKKKTKKINSREKHNKLGKQLNNPDIKNSVSEDAIYSKPRKWKFISKRPQKEDKLDPRKLSEEREPSETPAVERYYE